MLPNHLDALWARLDDPNDRIASSDFAAAVMAPLLAELSAQNPQADPDLVWDAVRETLVGLIQHPDRYDPEQSSLPAYLRMSARADLKNAEARERRHYPKLRTFVELDDFPGNESSGEDRLRFEDYPELRAVREGLDARDRAVLDLMLAGAKFDKFVAALGIAGSSGPDQRVLVKQAKDRIKARLKRAGVKP